MTLRKKNTFKNGYILVSVLVFGFIGVLILSGIIVWSGTNIVSSRNASNLEQAFQIAEAGVEYYRWHLAHAPLDFQDGTGNDGPYIHPYYDKEGVQIGQFSLDITRPATGTTIVTIKSTGETLIEPSKKRSIIAQLAIPSLAKYAVAANDEMRFGSGTEVFGIIHSNEGIRFDGFAHNLVTSARTSYDDPDHSGCNEWAVHTHSGSQDPCPNTPWNTRPDVFEVGREIGVPAIDFDGFTSDLANIKVEAEIDGHYFAGSGAFGYNIVLKTDDTFDLYRVNTLVNPPSGCTNSANQDGWGTWSIGTQTLLGNYPFPANGLIFLEDHVWVQGQINDARLTIASGRFPETPSTNTSITVNNDLTYTNYDGKDVIALIAQENINVGMVSDTDIRIDAALVAKSGRVGRYYYRPPSFFSSRCSPYHSRSILTSFGMIATNERYGFAYTDGTGYTTRNLTYDGNLLYGPPPSFPITGDQYKIISWKEVPAN
jgi:hypothetical protein